MPCVLIVDQDPDHIALCEAALAEHGASSEVTHDGALALQLVRTAKFDAIVLSVDLRGTSGYSVCNRLKKDPALARVPLLLTSAEASEETFAQHSRLKTRAEGYLRKPFDRAALWRAVAALWEPAAEAAAPEVAAAAFMEPVAVSWGTRGDDASPGGAGPSSEVFVPPAAAPPAAHAEVGPTPTPTGAAEAVPDGGAGAGILAAGRAGEAHAEDLGAAAAEAGQQGASSASLGDAVQDRTQPQGGWEAPPEVTVVRAADPSALAMSRAPAAPAARSATQEIDLLARLERLEATHAAAEARWRDELETARLHSAALAARLAAQDRHTGQVREALQTALRLMRDPSADDDT